MPREFHTFSNQVVGPPYHRNINPTDVAARTPAPASIRCTEGSHDLVTWASTHGVCLLLWWVGGDTFGFGVVFGDDFPGGSHFSHGSKIAGFVGDF